MLIQSGTVRTPAITPNSEHRVSVPFPKPYGLQPHVDVAIAAVDQDGGAGLRIATGVERVTAEGFEVVVCAGANTKLSEVTIRWTAFGISAEHRIDRDAHALEDPIEIVEADVPSGETASAAA